MSKAQSTQNPPSLAQIPELSVWVSDFDGNIKDVIKKLKSIQKQGQNLGYTEIFLNIELRSDGFNILDDSAVLGIKKHE